MAAFQYQALDQKGTRHKGVIQADSARAVREQLRQQGLTALTVEAAAVASEGQPVVSGSVKRLPMAQLLTFTRQLSALLKGAVPLSDALQIISKQSTSRPLQIIALSLRTKLQEGHSFAESLKSFPDIFPVFYVANITGAERIGILDGVLEELANVLEKERESRQKLMLALIYPAILVIASLGMTLFLMSFVVPTLVTALQNTNQELPTITQIVIGISNAVRMALPFIILVFAGSVLGTIMMRKDPKGRLIFDRKLLNLPGIGNIIRMASAARFGRSVSLLYGSGISLIEAITLAAGGEGNHMLRQQLDMVIERLRQGRKLHTALEEEQVFPLIFTCMVASGEESGRLKELMAKASDYHEQELRQRIAVVIHLLEPAILLFVGGVIALVMIAVLLPIMNLNRSLG